MMTESKSQKTKAAREKRAASKSESAHTKLVADVDKLKELVRKLARQNNAQERQIARLKSAVANQEQTIRQLNARK